MTFSVDPSPIVCSAIKANGEPCKAVAIFGSDGKCFMHSGRAAQAQRAGGKSHSKRHEPIEVPSLDTPEAQRRFIEQTISQVVNGDLALSVGKFCIYAASVLRQIGDDEIAKRLEALEQNHVNT